LISEQEKKRLLVGLSNEYISSEESVSEQSGHESNDEDQSGDERPPRPKVLAVKKLTWRSRELNDLMKRLDRRIVRRRSAKGHSMAIKRKEGPPSSRSAPSDAPEWTVV